MPGISGIHKFQESAPNLNAIFVEPPPGVGVSGKSMVFKFKHVYRQGWVTFECNSEALNSRSKNGMLWKEPICFENGLELSHHIPAVYSTIYCT